jgi:hypothetical protein
MEPVAVQYSSPSLAHKIAQNYGERAKILKVRMVASDEVSSLLARVNQAQKNARKKPLNLD